MNYADDHWPDIHPMMKALMTRTLLSRGFNYTYRMDDADRCALVDWLIDEGRDKESGYVRSGIPLVVLGGHIIPTYKVNNYDWFSTSYAVGINVVSGNAGSRIVFDAFRSTKTVTDYLYLRNNDATLKVYRDITSLSDGESLVLWRDIENRFINHLGRRWMKEFIVAVCGNTNVSHSV